MGEKAVSFRDVMLSISVSSSYHRFPYAPPDYDFEAHKELVPMQPGDVPTTYADASALERDFGFTPKITLREGLRKFARLAHRRARS